ncbi:MAG TPA: D-2-hydroxyacid dehydrogenase [Bacillota bacterium]|jgi:phosphoglycerate dehydrogenase-like enzyme
MQILALGVKPSHLDRVREAVPEAEIHFAETADEAAAKLGRAEILVTWGRPLTPELVAKGTGLSWIHLFSAGADTVLFPEMRASPAILTCSRGAHAVPMAEHVMAMILAFERDLRTIYRQQAAHEWKPLRLGELGGGTLGLVGSGGVAREIAKRAHCFGLRLLAVRKHGGAAGSAAVAGLTASARPAPDPDLFDDVWPVERLDELFAVSDHVVAAIPLTAETRHLIGAAQFRAMKPSAYFYNVGRGPVVDEAALIAALKEKRLAGAGLDVFETEPLPPDSPLWDLPNVIVSPHASNSSPRQLARVVAAFVENLERYKTGLPLLNMVDKTAGY